VVARDGDLVIGAQVRARLLGLHLLDLDAHVVVATARDEAGGTAPARRGAGAAAVGRSRGARPSDGDARPTPRPALSRAVRLLGEGSSALDDARVMRRQVRIAPARARLSPGAVPGGRSDGARSAGPP
jgi:hypothetical protein